MINKEELRLPEETIIDLTTKYHFSGKQNRHILCRQVADSQLNRCLSLLPKEEEAIKPRVTRKRAEFKTDIDKDYEDIGKREEEIRADERKLFAGKLAGQFDCRKNPETVLTSIMDLITAALKESNNQQGK